MSSQKMNKTYRFEKAVVQSLQINSSFDRFLVQTKVTCDSLTGKPTDVRQYKHF